MDHTGMTRDEWRGLMEAMEEVGPYYDRVNWLITFGMVDRWRKRAAEIADPKDTVLEIGSGPGNFTKHLTSGRIFCLEPSSELAAASKKLIDSDRVTLLQGVGEKVPLVDSSVD